MSELDDNFTLLLGRQPSDKDKQDLYRVRDALKLKATDSVWLLLMALQHYLTLYEQIPARIAAAARDVTNAVRGAAEAEARAAAAETKRALTEAVRQEAVKSASRAAGARFLQWLSVAVAGIFVELCRPEIVLSRDLSRCVMYDRKCSVASGAGPGSPESPAPAGRQPLALSLGAAPARDRVETGRASVAACVGLPEQRRRSE